MRYVAAQRFTVECVDELIISALPKKGWVTDETWREYVEFCSGLVRDHGPFRGWLILVFENGPTANQRKIISVENRDSLALAEMHRSVMVTDSTMLRGILRIAGWMTRTSMETLPVSPSNVRHGLEWLREKAKFDVDRAFAAYESLVLEGKD